MSHLSRSAWSQVSRVISVRRIGRLACSVALSAALSATFATRPAFSAVVAIVDSGVDLNHDLLKHHQWVNPGDPSQDKKDNDKNGKVDDNFGWNFAEKNREVIDMKYLGTFSADVEKFFEVQLRGFNGQMTEEDKKWIAEKRADPNFIKEMGIFGNFVHGTHVAAIAANSSPAAQIMAIKLLPTEVKNPLDKGKKAPRKPKGLAAFKGYERYTANPPKKISRLLDEVLMKGFKFLGEQQAGLLDEIGWYLKFNGAKVVNCSFGSSMVQARMISSLLLELILKRKPTPEETDRYAKQFVQSMIEGSRRFMVLAKDALFVVAAGNDGSDNDLFPTFPANVKRSNVITVAATHGAHRLAGFSNYGAKTVDVAAPGVGILSAQPGNKMLRVSGTSQAAPYVAATAALILEQNPDLSASDVREILIKTANAQPFLAGKIASGGMASPERAQHAARLSQRMPVQNAIAKALASNTKTDARSDASTFADAESIPASAEVGYVMPLPDIIDYSLIF